MSTEVPPPAPKPDPIDPDNFHSDSAIESAPEGLLDTTKAKTKTPAPAPAAPGTVEPDNFHSDSAPKG